jgi:hypothetical protein
MLLTSLWLNTLELLQIKTIYSLGFEISRGPLCINATGVRWLNSQSPMPGRQTCVSSKYFLFPSR